jgi:hypothetical protein
LLGLRALPLTWVEQQQLFASWQAIRSHGSVAPGSRFPNQ